MTVCRELDRLGFPVLRKRNMASATGTTATATRTARTPSSSCSQKSVVAESPSTPKTCRVLSPRTPSPCRKAPPTALQPIDPPPHPLQRSFPLTFQIPVHARNPKTARTIGPCQHAVVWCVMKESASGLLNVRETAQYLGLQVDTIYRKARLRELPSVKVGRALRFDVPALQRYVEQNSIKTID